MKKEEFIKQEYLIEMGSENPRARIWFYRMDSEPLVKKVLKFTISYSKEEVRRYLKKDMGINYSVTLWPAFAKEPPLDRKLLPAVNF